MSEHDVTQAVTGGQPVNVTTAEAIGSAAKKLDDIAVEMAKARTDDTARFDALHEEQIAQANILDGLKKTADEEAREAKLEEASQTAKAALEYAQSYRNPSKAHQIGSGSGMAPSFGGYQKGAFVYNLWRAAGMNNPEVLDSDRREAMALLQEMTGGRKGIGEMVKGSLSGPDALSPNDGTSPGIGKGGYEIPDHVKATLGTTAGTGLGLMPASTVDTINKPGRYRSAVTSLVTDIRGVSTYQPAVPVRASVPGRAVVALWGDTKEKVDLTYGGYTATMYTLARIYDVAKQFLRFSQGAAEQDVLQELAHAFELGEAFYILQGDGTDEPYGIQTAIAAAFGAYTSSFTASATTLAGSVAKAIATAAGDLAVRNRVVEAALLAPAAYWTMVSQGTDTAGFFFAPAGGPEQIRPGTLMTPFGLPVYSESQLAGTDDLLVGEFSALKVYFGESYRVDRSDEAGERWDRNLVGFRGEEEMGLDARAAVFTGAFQFVADVMP